MSTNPPAPQLANVAVSQDKTSATVTLGQTNDLLTAVEYIASPGAS